MSLALVTGAGGLVGSEAVDYFCSQGWQVIGLDNDMRAEFFGTSTRSRRDQLRQKHGKQYTDVTLDIRWRDALDRLFQRHQDNIDLIIHTAAQPSHDWAAQYPLTDFSVNAEGTANVLEATRLFSPDAVLIFTSTNKVYGDRPNSIPVQEYEQRFDIFSPEWHHGITEAMPIDACLHSIFGASKLAADVLVQEYGRYYGLKTTCLRLGCITGANHQGARLHGFLSYLVKCALSGAPYTIYGYRGKQVRDNIHARDLVKAFDAIYRNPGRGAVYNLGGGRINSCSILEAIEAVNLKAGLAFRAAVAPEPRKGDHRWYITNNSAFCTAYPDWRIETTFDAILDEMIEAYAEARDKHPDPALA